MSSDRFTPFSHPAETVDDEPTLLRAHLDDVAERAMLVVPWEAETPIGEPMIEIVRRLGLVHDIGKATTWFQQHIETRGGAPPDERFTYHAFLGGLLGYYTFDVGGFAPETCLAGFVAVAKHHGILPDVIDYIFERTSPRTEREQAIIVEQVNDIDAHVPSLAENIVRDATDGAGSWTEFAGLVRDRSLYATIHDLVSRRAITRQPSSDVVSTGFYASVLQMWSALVLADKTSAAGAPREAYEPRLPLCDVLEDYIEQLPSGDRERERWLNERRDVARHQVLDRVESVAESGRSVATITLPTGMGKTLTGLNAAFKLRDRTDRRRVIYALPFTSIIDQVAADIKGISGFDTDGVDDLLTIHHHLAKTAIRLDSDDENPTDEFAQIEAMLGESWRSGMTVTTFVQLFESLTGPRNAQSVKLPALYDSVVVLDEPQSLPHDWWKLVRRLVEILTEEYGAAVIAMTATQPRLFEEAVELIDDPKRYFEEVERVNYRLHESIHAFPSVEEGALNYRQAAKEIVDAARHDDTVLAICNTIDSARELSTTITDQASPLEVGLVYADLLEDEYATAAAIADVVTEEASEIALLHLTTRIRPQDRLTLIDTAKMLTEREVPLVVVSTQLVESGVDISFDRVYRDLAPIDSIVQAAGRCNRSFERNRGLVTIWWLDAPDRKARPPSVTVYNTWGESLLFLTVKALDTISDGDTTTIPEPVVAWDGVREYYRLLDEERDVGRQEYVDYLDTALIEQLGSLSLIKHRDAIDVIVCRTAAERALVDDIKDAWEVSAFDRVNGLLNEAQSMRVSVPVYIPDSEEIEKLSELDTVHSQSDIRWLDAGQIDDSRYFDATTGLVVPDETVEGRFL